MTNALQKSEPQNHLPTGIKGMSEKDMKDLVEFTKQLAQAPYYAKMGPGGVLAIWLTAKEMGLPPMMCLNGGMYTFSGQVTLSSKVINMLLLRAGHRADVLQLDDKTCKIRFVRGDRKKEQGAEFVYEYTMEDAKQAGLTGKKNWQTNPRDMLYNRCLSGGAIKHMPDATNGAYVIGEMPGDGEIIDVIPEDIVLPEQKKEESKPESKKMALQFVVELSTLFQQCSQEYQDTLNKYLTKKYKTTKFDELPEDAYEALLTPLVMKAEENQKQLADAEVANVKKEDE